MNLKLDLLAPKIYLCGLMGSGKSTVGRLLAQALNYPFLDSDIEVEKGAGKTIAEIFAAGPNAEGLAGESLFRALESQVLEKIATQPQAVVALGGGSLLLPTNLARIKKATLVYLRTEVKTLASRLSQELATRPLLKSSMQSGLDPQQVLASRLSNLLDAREPGFAQAQIQIATDDLNPIEIVEEILTKLPARK